MCNCDGADSRPPAPAPPMTVWRFAYAVAGPRDFLINLAVNGSIAWLVFGSHETVGLTGWGSIWTMLLPMAFLEASLTVFFGYLTGAQKRISGALVPTLDPGAAWLGTAVRAALAWGVGMLALATAVMLVLTVAGAQADLPPRAVIPGIGLLSGILAYVLHTRAVLMAGRL